MIKSMTGFGAAEGTVGAMRVSVELRSVNHRFFNPSIKLPTTLSRWETEVREALRKTISRGHVTVMARVERAADANAVIDESKFASYVKRLMELKERYALEGSLDLATVLRLPDVIRGEADEHDEGTAAQLVAIVEMAATALNTSREAEGLRLRSFVSERITQVESAVERLAARAPQRITEQHERLRNGVAELTAGVQVDPQRLAVEIALLADRLDVGEELERFRSHLAAFRETLAGNGADGGVGKRLGFLLQELLREANTTGSKANDTAMTRDVLAIKEELERIREQVENLE
jgi:uncharacterized protein (TIGR00255 family)